MRINKLYRSYLLFGVIYHIFTIFFLQRFANNNYMIQGFTDLYYVYPFAIYYMIGVNLINRTYASMFAIRYINKRRLILSNGVECALLAFVQVSLAYLITVIYHTLFKQYYQVLELKTFFFIYLLFVFGTVLLGLLSLLFRYSGVKILRNYSEILAYGILILELLILIPRFRMDLGINVNIFFSWIMYNRTEQNMMVLISLNIIAFLYLCCVAKRRDLN